MSTPKVAVPSRSSERRFYLAMTIAIFFVVFVGFARSFFLRPLFPEWPSPVEPIFYVHGAVFAAWCVLLVVQASLVASGRTPVHRRVGWCGAALAGCMVVLGLRAAAVAAARPTGFIGIPVPPLEFLVVPFVDLLLFSAFVALAIAGRRDTQAHKRWMLLATLSLTTAAAARWPIVSATGSILVFYAVNDLLLVPLVVWDLRTRNRLHPVTLWGGLLLVVSQPLRLALSTTGAWLTVARWVVDLGT